MCLLRRKRFHCPRFRRCNAVCVPAGRIFPVKCARRLSPGRLAPYGTMRHWRVRYEDCGNSPAVTRGRRTSSPALTGLAAIALVAYAGRAMPCAIPLSVELRSAVSWGRPDLFDRWMPNRKIDLVGAALTSCFSGSAQRAGGMVPPAGQWLDPDVPRHAGYSSYSCDARYDRIGWAESRYKDRSSAPVGLPPYILGCCTSHAS